VLLAYYITKPLENAINKQFVLKASKTLAEKQNLIKIAVTGSYGKTTVKEVLKQMLSVKYKTYATPESYNTPLGIAKSINNLTSDVEVFIAEMGARHVGDIKELALIVNPNIAVITGVTGQHLETFLTINNVKKTKYELIENMQGGKAYFSSDNSYAYEMYKECPFEKYIAGLDVTYNPVVYATDVEVTESGTNFTINYCNKKIACKTGLLGKHNVSDICLAASVALGLGVSLSQIAEVVCNVKPIKHRLELTVNDAGVKILDDGYNANPDGVNRALEVLKVFSGKKVVVTPGIVELGIYESERNYEFGANMATVANEVILVGRGSALKIREGLISAEFSTDNVYMVKDLEGAKEKLQEIVTSGDTVLFINDLPDKYN
jgi:UDP-N-acetylmuramoyl-tripeptide--D-alanyl-D-alanine ligase